MNLIEKELIEKIINAFYEVYNTLIYGFLEKVYEHALYKELNNRGFHVSRQEPIGVLYKGQKVGEYYADLVVEGKVILELKASESICDEHKYQLINYLKATNIEVGLLFNFDRKPQFDRKVFQNKNKI
ncbi:MAG: GxxExxY protein [Bacteroidales bacterium]|nr:GxxExxY protein [Bacteroidales bacterium]